ncbi:MAG: MFS transporter [Candidatus Thermoplasmatota archaeon]
MNVAEKYNISRDLFALSTVRFADAFGNGLLIIVIPLYLSEFEVEIVGIPQELLIGIVLASYGLASSFLQPFFGKTSDKIGKRKPFLVYGLIVVGIASFSFSFVDSFTSLLAANIFRGMAVAITIAPTMALVSEITYKKTRGGSMGVYTTMRMAGFAIAPIFSGIMIETIGFISVFILAGTVAIAISIFAQLWVNDSKPKSKTSSTSSSKKENKKIPSDLYILGLAIGFMVISISLITTLEQQFNQKLSQTAIGFSIAFSALIITRILFQTPIGHISDKKGRKNLVSIGMIGMGLLTFLLPYVQTTFELILIRIGQGIASAGVVAPGFALAADIAGKRKGKEMSVMTTSFMLGLAAGPLIAGLFAGYLSFESPFYISGILSVLGGILVYKYVKETIQQ